MARQIRRGPIIFDSTQFRGFDTATYADFQIQRVFLWPQYSGPWDH